MNVYPDTLAYARWDITADVDLASATAEVFIAAEWHALAWTGAATHTGDTWTRTARILISGEDAGGDVIPTALDSHPDVKVTAGGEVIVVDSSKQFRVNV